MKRFLRPHFAPGTRRAAFSGRWKWLLPRWSAIVAFGVVSAGCRSTHSPTVDVLGSYFPAWIICVVLGLVLTVIARQIFIGFKLDDYLRPAPVVYISLLICFTLLLWLIFFKN